MVRRSKKGRRSLKKTVRAASREVKKTDREKAMQYRRENSAGQDGEDF